MVNDHIADYLHNSLEHADGLKEASIELSDISGLSRGKAREIIQEWLRLSPVERLSMDTKATLAFLKECENL